MKALQIIAAVLILALGVWIGAQFSGCHEHTQIINSVDTLVIDTSQIIYKTPIIIKQINTTIIDSSRDCWGSLPLVINEHGDSLSIDSVNSCRGIYKGVRMNYKPDTVETNLGIIHDTLSEPFELPSFAGLTANALDFTLKAKVGSGFGMAFGTGLDASLSFGKLGLVVSPSFYYIREPRGFVSVLVTYTLIGK